MNVIDDSQAVKAADNDIHDVLSASRTGHTRQLRKLAVDQALCSDINIALMSDREVETLINKTFCCFYIRTDENDPWDMDTIYLIPRELAVKSAIIISR
ncbi:MAG: hypothetical protein CVT92_02650 [Bacteroidetes bacterium HGW-Bacteroidetes-1]|nr:MAG: hypothetical protein CVT92_02650 [Bacteroidetes bacterium HGW-Bacteroidetes-1]